MYGLWPCGAPGLRRQNSWFICLSFSLGLSLHTLLLLELIDVKRECKHCVWKSVCVNPLLPHPAFQKPGSQSSCTYSWFPAQGLGSSEPKSIVIFRHMSLFPKTSCILFCYIFRSIDKWDKMEHKFKRLFFAVLNTQNATLCCRQSSVMWLNVQIMTQFNFILPKLRHKLQSPWMLFILFQKPPSFMPLIGLSSWPQEEWASTPSMLIHRAVRGQA